MSNLTDRAAYLRGLAEGMGLDKEKNENKLMLEMLSVLDEMAQKVSEMDDDIGELEEYVDDIDADLADMEEVLFGDEDDECGCDDEDCDMCGEYEDEEELSFDCPHCGKSVMISTLTKAPCARRAASPSSPTRQRMTSRTKKKQALRGRYGARWSPCRPFWRAKPLQSHA